MDLLFANSLLCKYIETKEENIHKNREQKNIPPYNLIIQSSGLSNPNSFLLSFLSHSKLDQALSKLLKNRV